MKKCLKIITFLLIFVFLNTQAVLAHNGSSSNCMWLETEKEAFKSNDAKYFLIPPIGLIAGILFIADSIGCAIEKTHHPESYEDFESHQAGSAESKERNQFVSQSP